MADWINERTFVQRKSTLSENCTEVLRLWTRTNLHDIYRGSLRHQVYGVRYSPRSHFPIEITGRISPDHWWMTNGVLQVGRASTWRSRVAFRARRRRRSGGACRTGNCWTWRQLTRWRSTCCSVRTPLPRPTSTTATWSSPGATSPCAASESRTPASTGTSLALFVFSLFNFKSGHENFRNRTASWRIRVQTRLFQRKRRAILVLLVSTFHLMSDAVDLLWTPFAVHTGHRHLFLRPQ